MYSFLPPGTLLHGRYRILRVLGGGGMGAVYLAEDTQHGGLHVAVKEMRTESETTGDANSPEALEERQQAIDSFEREAEILKPLSHPNLPTFSDTFHTGGRPYVVMEFVPGESLEKKLDRLDGKPMGEREALYYGIQVARVLRYLHSQNPPIIFRDVKPANIMVMPNYQVKLIDFGIARKYKVASAKIPCRWAPPPTRRSSSSARARPMADPTFIRWPRPCITCSRAGPPRPRPRRPGCAT
jgi:serine/threonine protein kinase